MRVLEVRRYLVILESRLRRRSRHHRRRAAAAAAVETHLNAENDAGPVGQRQLHWNDWRARVH